LKIGHPTKIGWVITVHDWAQIRYLHGSEGLSIRAIASRLGLSRDTVSRAVKSTSPPKYSRVSGPSAFDPFESQVRGLLARFPTMPASVLAERVGWPGSPWWFRKKVARLRVDYVAKDPADRIIYHRGDQAQCDLWFPPVTVPLGAGQAGSPPVPSSPPSAHVGGVAPATLAQTPGQPTCRYATLVVLAQRMRLEHDLDRHQREATGTPLTTTGHEPFMPAQRTVAEKPTDRCEIQPTNRREDPVAQTNGLHDGQDHREPR
jgi:hypothetical protein